jgi:hypothetical protein
MKAGDRIKHPTLGLGTMVNPSHLDAGILVMALVTFDGSDEFHIVILDDLKKVRSAS